MLDKYCLDYATLSDCLPLSPLRSTEFPDLLQAHEPPKAMSLPEPARIGTSEALIELTEDEEDIRVAQPESVEPRSLLQQTPQPGILETEYVIIVQ
jgi:hypothetical protein